MPLQLAHDTLARMAGSVLHRRRQGQVRVCETRTHVWELCKTRMGAV
jgi:hypothetical protein